MTDAEKAAETFCASVKHDKASDFDEQSFLMWADDLKIDAVACNIEDPSCEACGS